MGRLVAISVGGVAWAVAVGALAVPLGAVCVSLLDVQAWAGTWRLSAGDRTALLWSVVLGVGGAAAAVVLALPIAWWLSRRPLGAAWVLGAALVPLLIPPQAYSYAWQIVAWGVEDDPSGWLHRWVGPGPVRAWWVTASWLWPLAALILAAGWQRTGEPVMRLAVLDASPERAFFRAALPAMRPFVVASLALVFLISVADSAVSDLSMMLRGGTYARVLLAEAQLGVPLGAVVVRAWPVLALIAGAGGVLLLEARGAARFGPLESESSAHAALRGPWTSGRVLAVVGLIAVLGVTVALPIGTLAATLREPASAWRRASTLFPEWRGSLAIGALVGLLCAALAAWFAAPRTGWRRTAAGAVVGAVVVMGVLPGAVTGYAMASAYNSMSWLSAACDPVVWALGLVGRVGMIAVVMTVSAGRTLGRGAGSLTEQVRVDGGGFSAMWAHVWLPAVWPTVLVGALVGAGLALGEVVVTTLLAPPGNWSIAVTLLNRMHFSPYDDTVVSTLLFVAPAIGMAVGVAVWSRVRARAA